MANNGNGRKLGITIGGGSIGFGAALAMVISYAEWNSILWAILHGVLGWIYVVYYIIVHR